MRKINIRTAIIALSITLVFISCKKDDKQDSNVIIDQDGNIYTSITIGSQEWMVENLKTTKYNDGTSIPNIIDSTELSFDGYEGYCWYNNDTTLKDQYGALYSWYVVKSGKLCPEGWDVPNENDWSKLVDYIGANGYNGREGIALKSLNGWYDNGNGTDFYGFSAKPSGSRGFDGSYGFIGYQCYWWSNSMDNNDAYFHSLFHDYSTLLRGVSIESLGFLSVRCIKRNQ